MKWYYANEMAIDYSGEKAWNYSPFELVYYFGKFRSLLVNQAAPLYCTYIDFRRGGVH